eukprot:COSAG02_NODE_38473_length_428_cov_1.404255_1_plen_64_part_00
MVQQADRHRERGGMVEEGREAYLITDPTAFKRHSSSVGKEKGNDERWCGSRPCSTLATLSCCS